MKKTIAYQIPKKMFNSMLSKRSESDKNKNPYDYVMRIINEDFGLNGIVKTLFVV